MSDKVFVTPKEERCPHPDIPGRHIGKEGAEVLKSRNVNRFIKAGDLIVGKKPKASKPKPSDDGEKKD